MENNKVIKAGIWYTISNFFIKGIAFITMPIFTHLMTQSDIGAFSNITSWFGILAIITTFELYSSIVIARFDHKDNIDDYISSILSLGTIITGIFYLIVIIFSTYFQKLFNMDMNTIHILFIYLLVYPSIQTYQTKNRITYNYKMSTLVSIGSSLISVLISLACVLLCSNALEGRILGFYVPSIIFALIVYIYLIRKSSKIKLKYWKYALSISIPIVFHLLAGNILSSSDRIMITKMVSKEANALYTVAYSCSMAVSILWTSMNTAWSPWAYEMMNAKKYDSLKKASKPYFLFFFVIVIILMFFAPEILYILGGKDYMEAVFIIPPVMVGLIFQFVYSLYVNIEYYNKKLKNIALGTIIAATINIGLNFLFIPIFGYIAAAYTTLIGYIILYLIHYLFVYKLGSTSWYDTKFFIKYLIASILLMIIMNVLYNYIYIRYGLIIVACILIIAYIIKNKTTLKKLLKLKSITAILRYLCK